MAIVLTKLRAAASAAGARHWLVPLGVPLIAAVCLLWLDTTDVDRAITSWFFDPVSHSFPLRYDEFLEVVLHRWAKYVVILLGSLAIAAFLLSFFIELLLPHRRVLLFVALSLALAPATVAALKASSSKHCPWDLAEYGGPVPYMRLFGATRSDVGHGRCFPAGHAASGFALMSFYFVGRARQSPNLARAGLATGLAAGLLLGLGRMMQGAHFLSHTLWSGLVCWVVLLALCALVLRRPAGECPCPVQ